MVIKIRKKGKPGEFNYKSEKQILTPEDVSFAENQEQELKKALSKAEGFLLKNNFLSNEGIKKNPLKVWYVIGATLNDYFKKNKINKTEEKLFWRDLYERDTLLHKSLHETNIAESRNDYKMAAFLSSKYSYADLENIGSWALVREIFSHKCISRDARLINLVVNILAQNTTNRDLARPFIKKVSDRFRFLESTILTDSELEKKFNQIEF